LKIGIYLRGFSHRIRHDRHRTARCVVAPRAPRVTATQCNAFGKFQWESGDVPCRAAPRRTVPYRTVADPVCRVKEPDRNYVKMRVPRPV